MDVFGGAWEGYVDKLAQGLSILQPEDTLVIAGDISWGMSLEEAEADFASAGCPAGDQDPHEGQPRLLVEHGLENESLFPGERVHYPAHSPQQLPPLRGDRPVRDPRVVLRGGQAGPEPKVFHRELQRLETSLKAAGDREKLCFLHYPPATPATAASPFWTC